MVEHKHEWYFLSGSVIFCKCFEELPVSEAEALLNSVPQLEADNAALKEKLSATQEFAKCGVENGNRQFEEIQALQRQVKRLPSIKIADGTVWLVFPNAMINIDSIGARRGPIVKKNLRAWRDKILEEGCD